MLKYLFRAVLLLIFCSVNSEIFGSESLHTADSSAYQTISARNLQRTTSLRDVKIIAPDEQLWKDLAKKLQGIIKEKSGIIPEIGIPDPAKFEKGWSGNMILLGNLGNNKQMARLYGLRLSYADAIYPGRWGYQLHTLIDPFGLGGNSIVISATDLEGAKLAVERLSALLPDQKETQIPWLFESKLPDETISISMI